MRILLYSDQRTKCQHQPLHHMIATLKIGILNLTYYTHISDSYHVYMSEHKCMCV